MYIGDKDLEYSGRPRMNHWYIQISLSKHFLYKLCSKIRYSEAQKLCHGPKPQWPFQEPKLEVPTICLADFWGLNFRENPHEIWPKIGSWNSHARRSSSRCVVHLQGDATNVCLKAINPILIICVLISSNLAIFEVYTILYHPFFFEPQSQLCMVNLIYV